VGHDREFGTEALDVFGLALEVAQWDEEREVGVLDPGLFDARVHLGLHPFPDGHP